MAGVVGVRANCALEERGSLLLVIVVGAVSMAAGAEVGVKRGCELLGRNEDEGVEEACGRGSCW